MPHYIFDTSFDPGPWYAAWEQGVAKTWPTRLPLAVRELLNVRGTAPYMAPEVYGALVAQAWAVYASPDYPLEVGRAAVALAYILASCVRKVA